MAHPANRPIDFAPAWLKLPEQAQVQKRQLLENSQQNSRSNSGASHHISNGFQSHSYHPSHQHYNSHNHHNSHTSSSSDRYNSHHHHHQTPLNTASNRHGRPLLNSYSGGRSSTQPSLLQRSQSTGAYTDSSHRSGNGISNSVPANDPLEEDFPLLTSGTSNIPSQKNLSGTVQWRVKPAAAEQQRSKEESELSTQNEDKKLLTSKLPGKVYRAQVRPVRRSNMIPINNGRGTASRSDQGDNDQSALSSSVEKEKRLLQEMGWKEEDDSEDDCVIPEQDPEQLQEIMMQAKAARERLLMKSKQTLKPTSTLAAVLPNEDELPSSSDNSDVE